MVVGMLTPVARRGAKFWFAPGRWKSLNPDRVVVTCIGAAIAALLALLVPWPYEIVCPVEIQAHGAEAVVVSAAGTLAETFVQPGEAVKQGQPLARLENTELEMQLADGGAVGPEPLPLQRPGQAAEALAAVAQRRALPEPASRWASSPPPPTWERSLVDGGSRLYSKGCRPPTHAPN